MENEGDVRGHEKLSFSAVRYVTKVFDRGRRTKSRKVLKFGKNTENMVNFYLKQKKWSKCNFTLKKTQISALNVRYVTYGMAQLEDLSILQLKKMKICH